MTKRTDIDRRLVYSCNCGWIDKGHANPTSHDPYEGAVNLWNQVKNEKYATKDTINGRPCFQAFYKQKMGKGFLSTGFEEAYLIRKGLSVNIKEQIALRIFLDVSLGFENLQASWPYRWITDSGFSQEDLISNIIGFYQAVRNLPPTYINQACKFVSKQASLNIWDKYHPRGIGSAKNNSHTLPTYYPCPECSGQPLFPAIYRGITPASYGSGDFIRYKQPFNLVIKALSPRNFDSNGKVIR